MSGVWPLKVYLLMKVAPCQAWLHHAFIPCGHAMTCPLSDAHAHNTYSQSSLVKTGYGQGRTSCLTSARPRGLNDTRRTPLFQPKLRRKPAIDQKSSLIVNTCARRRAGPRGVRKNINNLQPIKSTSLTFVAGEPDSIIRAFWSALRRDPPPQHRFAPPPSKGGGGPTGRGEGGGGCVTKFSWEGLG